VVMESMLRRKKTDHGMFEDPWKLRMMCKLVDGVLEAVVVQDGKMAAGEKWETKYDLKKDWYLPPDRRVGGNKSKFDPLRFDIVRKSSGEVASFKSESVDQTGAPLSREPQPRPALRSLWVLTARHATDGMHARTHTPDKWVMALIAVREGKDPAPALRAISPPRGRTSDRGAEGAASPARGAR